MDAKQHEVEHCFDFDHGSLQKVLLMLLMSCLHMWLFFAEGRLAFPKKRPNAAGLYTVAKVAMAALKHIS